MTDYESNNKAIQEECLKIMISERVSTHKVKRPSLATRRRIEDLQLIAKLEEDYILDV